MKEILKKEPKKQKPAKKYKQGDVEDGRSPVIIILGQTGVGKSTFISVAGEHMPDTLSKPTIGSGLESCTSSLQEYILNDPKNQSRSVRLVDTPGFNDTTATGDDKQVKLIIEWLRKEPKTKLAGILFLCDITQTRATNDSSMMNPSHIETPPGVIVVTTKWSNRAEQIQFVTREEKLGELFSLEPSAMKRFLKTPESAWMIIDEVWGSPHASKITLETVRELLESIRPHLKEPEKLMRKIGKWFARLF